MRLERISVGVVAVAALIANPLSAQDHRFQVYAHAGALMPLANLQQTPLTGNSGTFRHFTGGIDIGAGAFVWLDNNLGLRAEASYAGAKVSSPESNEAWTKIFFGGDVVIRAAQSGLSPFGYFGLGAVRMDESGSRTDAIGVIPTTTRPVGRFGAGLNFTPESGALGIFAEASLLAYDFNQTRFPFYDKVQTDVAWKAGISFKF